MAKPVPAFTSTEDFFFKTPLYSVQQIDYNAAMKVFRKSFRVDGYCPYCRQQSTFVHRPTSQDSLPSTDEKPHFTGQVALACARSELAHIIVFHCRMASGLLQKVGQYPSFADIALDESKNYSKLLSSEDEAEFHRAIGLAAHNVGIGSYVYLRRIFERLIVNRFEEFKAAEGWSDGDFYGVRMDDKVSLLKDHLPPFLVRNARIYSILSLGIHELREDQCLAFFNVLRQSLVVILEEDKKKKEDLERQKQLEKEIAAFTKPDKELPAPTLASLGDSKYITKNE
ncbi:hypothetical protein [Bradyrhizobium sp.]|uniref:hypothetical protein n=1 Tax=Bradyrhizobium sp. TaxID=376 RepID=UPI002737450B|nr:hypothetical protein [Bradyrhizobium sp.]MDP3078675.1 hypothetical protein [Bradyrhizobium sp.]